MQKTIIILILIVSSMSLLAQTSSITYPKNRQVIKDSIINFQWDEVLGATNYQLQIANDSLFQTIIYDTITANSKLSLNLNLNLNVNFARFKSNNHSDFSSIIQYQYFNPKLIDSLVLWLAADTGVVKDVNGKVSQWNDLSGYGNDASQASLTLQPSLNDSVIGIYPSISYLGGSYTLSGSYSQLKPNNKNRSLILLVDNQYVSGYNNVFCNFEIGTYSYKYWETSMYPTQIALWIGNSFTQVLPSFYGNYLDVKVSILNVSNSVFSSYVNNIFKNENIVALSVDSVSNYAISGRTKYGSSISNAFNGQVFEIIDYAKPLNLKEIQLVNKYLLDKYTSPVNLGSNILRRYGFCGTTLSTTELYESYVWSTGDTTREISITKEDTGWYWCDVPNLYGDIMRDSVYVYNFLVKPNLVDTLICYGDSSSLSLPSSLSSSYIYEWKNSLDVIVSTDSVLKTTLQDKYTLKITDSLGCFITDTVKVWVDSFALDISLGSDKSICSGEKVGLISGQAQADSFLWNTGSIDSLLIVNTAGTYSLRTANSLGCIARDTIDISIHGISPMVNFSADTVCFNDSSLFIDASQSQDASNLTNWKWDFNDGTSPLNLSTPQPFNHFLPDSGTYSVKLTVSTDSNCSNYSYKNIYIRPLPQPNFITSSICENINTEFQNTTVSNHDSISNYKWIFYDGITPKDTLDDINPSYYYNSNGNQRVDLIATSVNNCVDSISKTISIKESPIANYLFTDVCDGDSVSYTDLSSSNAANPLINREWIFNLNDTSNSINPKHLFDSAHIYSTSLKITSQNTCWDTISKFVKVNAIPIVDFISDSSCLNAITGFYDNSFIKDDTIKSYNWNFGSFGNSNIENPEQIYPDTNLQQISLIITSGANCVDSIIKNIKTHPLPKVDFSSDKEYGEHPFDVQFNNESEGAISYSWNFDDGSLSVAEAPMHTFTDSTIYDVKLISTNEFTCSDSINKNIYGVYISNDVAIISAPLIEKDDSLSFYCEILNNGQQRIRDLKLELSYNDTLNIIEYWQGELLPENSMIYNFNSKITNYRKDTINNYSIKIIAFNNTEEYDTLNNTIDNSFHINAISDTINPISLVYPKNKQVVSDNNIEFQWNAAMSGLLSGVKAQPTYNLQFSTDSAFTNSINILNLSKNSYFVNDLQLGEKYYWKVRSINDTLYSDWSEIWSFTYFNPSNIDSLVLWLSADKGITKDSLNRISLWQDQSGNFNHSIQNNTSIAPVLQDSSITKFPQVIFNSSSFILGNYSNNIVNNSNRTIIQLITSERNTGFNSSFVNYFPNVFSHNVIETSMISNSVFLWQGDGVSYSSNEFISGDLYNNTVMLNYNNLNVECISNGIIKSQFQFTLNVDSIPNYCIGGRTKNGTSISNGFTGKIAEIIDYSKSLDSNEIQLVNKYLLDKYTSPINLGAKIVRYYGFCDTTLSTEEMYESYIWNTGDTTRQISIGKEDTGWYWCDVPNLYGELMRDSVYVYDLVPKQAQQDTLICYGDNITLSSALSEVGSFSYNYLWRDQSNGDTLSTFQHLNLSTTKQLNISLKIEDFQGCYTTDTFIINVDSFQLQASLGSDQSLCTGNKIGLFSGNAEADSFLWSNGSSNSLIEIYTAGTYSLIVRDTLNCVAKDTILIGIHGVTPMVSFSADTVCFKDSSLFIDASQSLDASNLVNWEWDFADGSSPLNLSTSNPFSHLLPDSGTYNVKLSVSTDSNCTNYTYKNIYIRPLPQPNFNPITACENHELNFENLSAPVGGEIQTYYWNYGTGDTAISNPSFSDGGTTYIYNQAGDYNTILGAIDIHGCYDSIIKTVSIKPTPNADFNNSVSCEGDDISFADNSTTESFLPINTWLWTFDTTLASTSSTPSPIHHFDTAGFYPVNLYVKSINGCWDTITKMVQLHAIPEANFTTDTACINSPVNFTESSTIEDGAINYYYWLQDGIAFSADQNSSFIFNDTLEHNVVLKVRTTALCEDSVSQIIKVHPLPQAAFTTDRVYGLPPLTVGFINQSTSTSTSTSTSSLTYQWYFGDGSNSYDENPLHTYNDSAVFYPKLYAFNKFGCMDSALGVIYAVYSAVDVSVGDIKAEINDGFISYSCRITNLGKQKLTELELSAKYNSGLGISEQWQGELHTGESIDYVFSSKNQIPNSDQIKYFCIEAQVSQITDQEDENPDNNYVCKDISTNFWVSTPYPNPATNEITIDIILPYSQTMEVELINISGKVLRSSSLNGQKGLNNITLSVQTLSHSQYSIRIITNEGIEVRGFVK